MESTTTSSSTIEPTSTMDDTTSSTSTSMETTTTMDDATSSTSTSVETTTTMDDATSSTSTSVEITTTTNPSPTASPSSGCPGLQQAVRGSGTDDSFDFLYMESLTNGFAECFNSCARPRPGLPISRRSYAFRTLTEGADVTVDPGTCSCFSRQVCDIFTLDPAGPELAGDIAAGLETATSTASSTIEPTTTMDDTTSSTSTNMEIMTTVEDATSSTTTVLETTATATPSPTASPSPVCDGLQQATRGLLMARDAEPAF
ncbi:MAG: hypothetical protein Q9183_007351, partial [Haloplaca sp. 2 TL-2023]